MNQVIVNNHPHQSEIFYTDIRNKVIVSGRRWGKSILGQEEALRIAKQIPNALIWIVAPTREMVKDIHWDSIKKRVKELHWRVRINESNLSITRLLNGSKIILKSADNPDRLRGRGLDLVVIDEFRDMEQNIWKEILRPALADKKGRVIFTSTPHGYDVLYDLYQLGQRGEPDWRSWTYKTIDSPFIDKNEVEQAKRDLDERTYRQEFEASFETATGLMYYTFDRKLHLRPITYDYTKNLYLTFDFNTNPMTTSFCQIRPKENDNEQEWVLNIIKALNTPNSNTEYQCIRIKEFLNQINWQRKLIITGDATNQKRTESNYTNWEIVKQHFPLAEYLIPSKNPPVIDRINSVCAKLRNAKNQIGMYINTDCIPLITDFEKVTDDVIEHKDKYPDLTHNSDNVGYLVWQKFPLKTLARGYQW